MTINEKTLQAFILEVDEIEFVCENKTHKAKRKRRYKKKGKYVYDKYFYNNTTVIIKRFNYQFENTKVVGKDKVTGFGKNLEIKLDKGEWNVDLIFKRKGERLIIFNEYFDLTIGDGSALFGGEITLDI